MTPIFGQRAYYEKDNIGTRFTSADQAGAHRLMTRGAGIEEPCIDYVFPRESDALAAMLDVPCIKMAKDTKNLICVEVLKFGVFRRYEGADDAFIALLEGKGLARDLWTAAKNAFEKHGGREVAAIEPPQTAGTGKPASGIGSADAVKFSHEENRIVAGFPATYKYYDAPDKASAMAFLKKNSVMRPSYFLVVRSPEGTFCRDIQGFFEGQ